MSTDSTSALPPAAPSPADSNGEQEQTPTTAPSTGAQMGTVERVAVAAVGVGLAALGLRGPAVRKLALLGAGAGLAALAARGSNPLATALKIRQDPTTGDTLVSDAVTIGQPADVLYAQWRTMENLPSIMSHLQRVEVLDARRSRWTVKAPIGEVSWEAELTAEEPGRRLAWQSLPGADIENSGEVLFRPAPGDRGTELVVRLRYKAPGGTAGAVLARVAGQEPSQQLRDDLMRFKRMQELGFAPTTEGQSSGRAKHRTAPDQSSSGEAPSAGGAA